MKKETLLEIIGNISDEHIAEFSDFPEKKTFRQKQWGILAACFVLMLAAMLVILPRLPLNQGTTPPDIALPGTTPPDSSGNTVIATPDSDNNLVLLPETPPLPTIVANINEISEPNRMTSMINLASSDFTPMTYDELLAYFDTSLPIEETFPLLSLVESSADYGVYQSPDRGIYYDGNTVIFSTSDNAQKVCIILAKEFKHASDFFELSEDELHFTEVNGRKLAVFHYTNALGDSCYYLEFIQNDIAYFISTQGISEEDFVKIMQILVLEDASAAAGDTHSLYGTIIAVDPYANQIGIKLDANQSYAAVSISVKLPEGEAQKYSLDEHVTVTYTGEPATVCSIWEQQLIGIESTQETAP